MEDVDLERLVLPVLLALLILGAVLILVTSGGGGEDSLAPAVPAAVKTQAAPSSTTARTTTAPAPAPASSGRFAKVAQGDTASSIAQAVGLTVDRLAELNPSIDLDTLRLGQTLKLAP